MTYSPTTQLLSKAVEASDLTHTEIAQRAGFKLPSTITMMMQSLSYSPKSLDRFWRNLSYSLHLLIGLGCVISLPVDHSGWFAAKGGMRALVVVELDPLSDASFGGTDTNMWT